MLRAETDPDDSRRNSPQYRKVPRQPQEERRHEGPITAQYAADESILDEDLQRLGHAGRKLSASLNLAQRVDADGPLAQP